MDWRYILLALVVLLIVRWIMVNRALREREPTAIAVGEAAPIMMQTRLLLDYVESHPNMDIEERDEGLQALEDTHAQLIGIMRRDIGADGLVYIRHFLNYTDFAMDCYRNAPFDTSSSSGAEEVNRIKRQREELDAQGMAIISKNPNPSMLRMMIFGVPRVKAAG